MPGGREVISRLMVEVDGDVDALKRSLADGGTNLDAFGRKATALGSAGESLGGKYGSAARQIASATENIARTGQVAGDAVKQVIAQGAEVALTFGPAGAIVGSIGIATLAIVELFNRTSAAAKKATDDAVAELHRLRTEKEQPQEVKLHLNISEADQRIAELKKKIADAQRDATVSADELFRAAPGAKSTPPRESAETQALRKQLGEVIRDRDAGVGELTRTLATNEVSSLAAVLSANVATNEQRARAVQLTKNLRVELDKTVDATERTRIAGQIKSLQDPIKANDAAAKAASAAEKAVREKQSASLRAFDAAIAAQTPGKTDDLAAQIKSLTDAAVAAGDGADVIAAKVAALRAAAAENAREQVRTIEADLRASLVDGVSAAADAAQRALQEFDAKREAERKQGVFIDPVVSAQARVQIAALGEAAVKAEELKGKLADLDAQETSGRGRVQTMRDYLVLLDQAQHDVDATAKGTKVHTAAVERLRTVQAEVSGLQAKSAADAKAAAESARQIEGHTERLAGGVAAAANVAAGLATAFAGANSEITRSLSGVASLAGGIEDLLKKARDAGGLGALLSTGGGLASAASGIGAIVAGGGAIASALSGLLGESPADKEHRAALEANTKAVAALTKVQGDLVGLSVGGSTFAAAQRAAQQAVQMTASLSDKGRLVHLEDFFARAGVSSDDLAAIAKSLNITLDGTAGSLRALAQALNDADYKAFADSWSGILEQLSTFNTVDHVTDPLALARRFGDTLGTQSNSSALQGVLAAGSFDTEAGRQAMRDAARKLLDAFRDGLVTPEARGKLTNAEFRDALVALIGDLDAVGTASSATGAAADAAAAALSRLNQQLDDVGLASQAFGASAETIFTTLDDLATAFPAFGDQIRGLIAGVDVDTPEGRAAFGGRVTAFLQTIFAGGLTDTERELVKQLLPLRSLVDGLGGAASAAAPALDGVTSSLGTLGETARDVFGEMSAAADAAATDARRNGQDADQAKANTFSSQVAGLGPIDLHDPASVARARATALGLYNGSAAGDMKNFFGGIVDFLEPFIARAADVGASSRGTGSTSAVADVSHVTEETAGALVDAERAQSALLQQLVGIETDIRAAVQAMATAAAGSIAPPFVPQIAGGSGVASAAGGLSLSIGTIQTTIDIGALGGASSREAILDALASLTAGEADRRIGDLIEQLMIRRLTGGRGGSSAKFALTGGLR